MFRQIHLNKKNQFKAILMKSKNNPLAIIPNECINEITYNLQECHKMEINIQKQYKKVFDKILGRRQQIIVENNGHKDRFTIEELTEEANDENKDIKNIIAYSFEKTLDEGRPCTIKEGSYQLYNDGTSSIENDGILNMLEQDRPSWKIGTVSKHAQKEFTTRTCQNVFSLYKILTDKTIEKEEIFWEKDINNMNIKPIDKDHTMSVKIDYGDIKIYNQLDMLQKQEVLVHEFPEIHAKITHIKCCIGSTEDYQYALLYTITLEDGVEMSFAKPFFSTIGLKIQCTNVTLIYNNGNTEQMFTDKQRGFDEQETSWLTFLRETVQTAFDVIFFFDTYNKVINCYARTEVGKHTGIFLSYQNFIKAINKNNLYEDLKTELIINSDRVSISEVNPLGSNKLLNYDYFIRTGILSEETSYAWKRYNVYLSTQKNIIKEYRENVLLYSQKIDSFNIKKNNVEQNIKALESIRGAYIKSNESTNVTRLTKEISEKQQQLDDTIKELELLNKIFEEKENSLKELIDSLSMNKAQDSLGKIFTQENLNELEDITISETIEDVFYDNAEQMYDFYSYILTEKNKLGIEFETTVKGFLQNLILPKDKKWTDIIDLGDFVEIKDKDIISTKEDGIRLLSYTYSPKEKKVLTMLYSNKDKRVDDIMKIGQAGNSIKKSKEYTKRYKNTWKQSNEIIPIVQDISNNGINLDKQKIGGATESSILKTIGADMYLADATNPNNQIFIGGGVIATTADSWETTIPIARNTGVSVDAVTQVSHVDNIGESADIQFYFRANLSSLHSATIDIVLLPFKDVMLKASKNNNFMPSNINLYINDTLVLSKCNSTKNIDILKYVKLQQLNNIRITSETTGRVFFLINIL